MEEDLFESVQRKLRARRGIPPRRMASENLLVGLTRCGRCGASMFVQRPGNPAKRHYRYYVCAKRAESRSCDQPYIPAGRLEGVVIGKLQELADHPARIRPFLSREIQRRRSGNRDLTRRARTLDRRLAELEARQRGMVDWLAETMPGKAAARKLNQKIETLEKEKNALTEEQTILRGRLAAGDLERVSAEDVASHLARFGYYFDRFNTGQRKALVEAVVRKVEIESSDRVRAEFMLPTAALGGYDEDRQNGGSNWYLQWRPQRDEDPNPNGIPAEFVIALGRSRPSPERRSRKRTDGGGGRSRSKASEP